MPSKPPADLDEQFHVYLDFERKDYLKRASEENIVFKSGSWVHAAISKLGIDDLYIFSMENPSCLSVIRRKVKEFQPICESAITFKDNDTLIICGGTNKEFAASKFCYEYSISLNKVKKLPDMHVSRNRFVMFYEKGRIYVFGGKNTKTPFMKNCEYFDYASGKWVEMADLNNGRCRGSVISYRDEFWLIGGCINDSKGYLIERYIESENRWEVVDIKFGTNFTSLNSEFHILSSPCENEVLIFKKGKYTNRMYKLNLMQHTIMRVPEFGKRNKMPAHAFPIDEYYIMAVCQDPDRYVLYDSNEDIVFIDFMRPKDNFLPIEDFRTFSQRKITVAYSDTPYQPCLDRDYSAINLVIGNYRSPFQVEINAHTAEIEIYPVKTDLLLSDQDVISRISDTELFIVRSLLTMNLGLATNQVVIYNLNSRTYKNLPSLLISRNKMVICYFKKYVYLSDLRTYHNNDYIQVQRYNLMTDAWELAGRIKSAESCCCNLIPCQSRLYAVGRRELNKPDFLCVFNEKNKCWEFCALPSLNLRVDVFSEYFSNELLLYNKNGQENEIYWYDPSKGDLAPSPSFIGKQKSIKDRFGVINIAGTYISFGTNNKYACVEFQCLDPRKDEEIAIYGLKNIDWTEFKHRFNKLDNVFICQNTYIPKYHVFPPHSEKEVEIDL